MIRSIRTDGGVHRWLRGTPDDMSSIRALRIRSDRGKNRTESPFPAKVQQIIGVITGVFGFTRLRYQGCIKNSHRLLVTYAWRIFFQAADGHDGAAGLPRYSGALGAITSLGPAADQFLECP